MLANVFYKKMLSLKTITNGLMGMINGMIAILLVINVQDLFLLNVKNVNLETSAEIVFVQTQILT
jgi:hypothetical protein